MGIRIKKQIGYFIPNSQLADIFFKDYNAVLESYDEDSEKEKEFFERLYDLMTHYEKDNKKDIYLCYLKNEYEKEKIHYYELINDLFFGDNSKGIIIKSLEQHKTTRYDDLIDYYENSMTDNIKYINRPIHPTTGYIYQGGLSEKFPELVEGNLCTGSDAAFILSKATKTKEPANTEKFAKWLVKKGHFTPVIEPLIYLIAKAAQVLKDDVSQKDFNKIVKPVIATTWS